MSRLRMPPVGFFGLVLDSVPTSRSKELAIEIEQLGYGAVWLTEVAGRDPFIHLTHLLSVTKSLMGCTGVANIWARDAIAMGAAARSLTEAFPERFVLGLGVSNPRLVTGLRGHDFTSPVRAMASYLEAMDSAPYTGVEPTTPVRRVLGSMGPRMVALAGSRTDGLHPYLVPPEYTAWARQILGPEPILCPVQYYILERDAGRARAIARRMLEFYCNEPTYIAHFKRLGYAEDDMKSGGSEQLVDALVVWGSAETVLRRVRAHLDAGADHVAVHALTTDRQLVQVDRQWREMAPAWSSLC